MLLQKIFGKKVENKSINFEEATSVVGDLREKGAYPVRYQFKTDNHPLHVRKNPDYDYVLKNLQTFLAPYQYESNPQLKGDTNVKYVVRDFLSNETHNFYFEQIIDNLFRKGISVGKAKLKIKLNKN